MIIKNSYLKGLILLFSGSVISQGITFLFTPVISRLFLPEQMGAYTLVLSVVNMFGSIVCARYDMVIVSSECEEEVHSLISLGIIIGIISSIIITMGFAIYTYSDYELSSLIGNWCFIIFPILIIYAAINILTAYNNRHGEYGLISKVNILRATAQGTLQTVSGLIGFGSMSLVISYLLSNIVGIKHQARRLLENNYKIFSTTKEQLLEILNKYKNQPLFSVPAIFFNSASYSLLPFFINSMFDAREVGLYSISFRLLGVPLALISTNVSRVFFQKASELHNKYRDFSKIYLRTALLLLFVIALPMVIVLYFFGEELITLVFGREWTDAGKYVKLLAPMFGVRLIVSTLSVSLIITEKQKYDMILQSLFLVATIFAYVLSKFLELELNAFISIISILFFTNYLVYGYIGYYFSRNNAISKV
ncbi:lipopolysaccharide biosynthesis protein [Clostridium thermosuccinogenes]|uniref:lipopolysaccharide biosynthesis protein n=1 Tax=Clostridium thermosuccinogenes TaxID=84032 RepID=UPI001379A11C|nr:oligosaccharide flippase family protein [Pseudoclostridium thermosuccinogenes]